MKQLLLVQHCQSVHHVNREACCWPDRLNGLTELGRRQAAAVAARLQRHFADRPCRLYASDMQRARETAELVAAALGQMPILSPALREFNGRFAVERNTEGKPWPSGTEEGPLMDWRPIPEAESWREFYARVATFLNELVRTVDDSQIPILVIHGGTVSNIVVWWLGLELDRLPERTPFAASPGSINVLRTNQFGNHVVERLNDTSHLCTDDEPAARPLGI